MNTTRLMKANERHRNPRRQPNPRNVRATHSSISQISESYLLGVRVYHDILVLIRCTWHGMVYHSSLLIVPFPLRRAFFSSFFFFLRPSRRLFFFRSLFLRLPIYLSCLAQKADEKIHQNRYVRTIPWPIEGRYRKYIAKLQIMNGFPTILGSFSVKARLPSARKYFRQKKTATHNAFRGHITMGWAYVISNQNPPWSRKTCFPLCFQSIFGSEYNVLS